MRHGIRSACGGNCHVSAVVLGACGRGDAASAPQPAAAKPAAQADLASVHADAPGIAWFNGDVDAAFASAQASNKPVLLYWGAQWCPPCKQLKSAVFSRPDFIEKSKLFVAVYLDGDLPDAQKWGDEFRVTGYPTVVVFKPDRTEITRIAGNMDLSLYAGVLDDALGDVRPVKDVIELAVKGEAPLARRRLPPARVSRVRSRRRRRVSRRAKLQTAFENAARLCPADLAKERARLHILAPPNRPPSQQKDAIEKRRQGRQGADRAHRARQRTAGQQRARRSPTPMRCAGCAKEFYPRGAPDAAAARARRCASAWMAIADATTANPQFAPADQLAAQLMKITRGQGVCGRRQGSHRRAQRRARHRRRRCWP